MYHIVRMGSLYEPGIEQLGYDIVKEHLREAAQVFLKANTPSYRAEAIQESLAFVRGSDLNVIVETFGLELDADTLRETFFTWAAQWQKHQSSR